MVLIHPRVYVFSMCFNGFIGGIFFININVLFINLCLMVHVRQVPTYTCEMPCCATLSLCLCLK